jgi:FtsH-binding integral membrane protein
MLSSGEVMEQKGGISIWFFIGISLLVNGLLILGAGLYEFAHPPVNRVVLYHLHASVWWGAILFLMGVFYCYRFSPRKDSRE